ncbi:MAG: xanthine dehydrogenase family protein molybdopterin-binding subunit [Chloroflexi bacterium]|nr:xanthine dehydrogenase family protein molybdopterin-binding subunit [Chloroflexota bacterium]
MATRTKHEPNVVLSTQDFGVVGTRPTRHDALDKVTGRANYGDDVQMPGLLHGKILRSPHAHARIRSIDSSRALALPGVKAVATSADLPQISGKVADLEAAFFNYLFLSNNCLANEKVLYVGHAVAAVAAISAEIAEEALSLIDVAYEVLPAVFNGLEAIKEGAPILHDQLETTANAGVRAGGYRDDDADGEGSNLANKFEFRLGDVVEGFQQADVIVEREYRTEPVHQGYIEPHGATALWSADGTITIWSSSQGQFAIRDLTARILDIPESRIKAIPMEIGGGFGGKTLVYLEPVAAVLSRKTGHPVKLLMDRAEVFMGTGPTSGTNISVKIGATKEGRITAAEARLVYEAGAYPGSPVAPGSQCIFAPYDIANVYVEGLDVVVNTPKSAAYRAPGAPAAAFAAESAIDEVCERLDMDPIEFRLLNGAKEGTRRVPGPMFPRIGYLETLQAAKEHPHYNEPIEGPNRGRGVASGFWFNGTGPASATASVTSDGTVSLVEGSADIGGSRTVAAMQLAEVLGILAEDVHPSVGDTDSIGYTSVTGGSSVAFKTGWACYEAGQDIKRQLVERAAKIWEIGVEDVEYRDGAVRHTSDPELTMSFKELAARLNATGGPVVGRATVDPRGVGGAFATHIVDVEVDPETGKVTILRYTAVQDVGKAVHPTYVEGQIQGGVAQGIGWALNEEYVFSDEGRMMNPTFLDYRMPTALDVPMLDTVIVEVANPGHPFGVRGVGEVPIVPCMAAISNAIYQATGLRFHELPMSPSRVLGALHAKNGSP